MLQTLLPQQFPGRTKKDHNEIDQNDSTRNTIGLRCFSNPQFAVIQVLENVKGRNI
jgi:hypothetical protein